MRRRRSGPRYDWVYRDDGLEFSVGATPVFQRDGLGTYVPISAASSITSPSAIALILYDSQNYARHLTHGAGGVLGAINQASRAEGRKALWRMSLGVLFVQTSSWAINNALYFAWRVGVFRQDPDSGSVLVDPAYSLWANTGTQTITQWANLKRSNVAEGRLFKGFQDTTTAGFFPVGVMARARGRGLRLEPDECVACYMETASGSVNCRVTPFLRSLVSDEG